MFRSIRKLLKKRILGQTTPEYVMVAGLIAAGIAFAGYKVVSRSGNPDGVLDKAFKDSLNKGAASVNQIDLTKHDRND